MFARISAIRTGVVVASVLVLGGGLLTGPAAANGVACDTSNKTEFDDAWASLDCSVITIQDDIDAEDTRYRLDGSNSQKIIDLNGWTLTAAKGIHVPATTELTIRDESGDGDGELKIDDVGDFMAGIGGNGAGDGPNAGRIIISGGAVDVVGGLSSAGIGGGPTGDGGEILLSGAAMVTVTGGKGGAGIGGGVSGQGGEVTVDGNATVTATGGVAGAGIGGGFNGEDGGTIEIKGHSTVTATGGEAGDTVGGGAGIGGGISGQSGEITIAGDAIVNAFGGDNGQGGSGGAGIGGGFMGEGGETTFEGNSTITATGGAFSSGIGGGAYSSGGEITISGDTTVAATGGVSGSGIGSGGYSSGASTVTVSGGTVSAKGGSSGAGIGSGQNSTDGGTLTIKGHKLQGSAHSGNADPDVTGGDPADVSFDTPSNPATRAAITPVVNSTTGSALIQFTTDVPATLTTSSLPEGQVGKAYSAPLAVTGTSPVTFGVTELPAGLTFDGGAILGIPTTPGTKQVKLSVSNVLLGLTQTDEETLPLTVKPADRVVKTKQSLRTGTIPKRVKFRGMTTLLKSNATTSQGRPISARVSVRLSRGEVRCIKVTKGKQRKLSLRTYGKCAMQVKVTYTAPGDSTLSPLRIVRTFRVKQ